MKIGIDARCLARQLTGIGYYTLKIIKALDKSGIETVLFSPTPLQLPGTPLKHSTTVHGNVKSVLARQLWAQFYLPFIIKQHKLDLFWGPSHQLPFFLNKDLTYALTIHDLVWRRAATTMQKSSYILSALLMPPSLKKADLILAVSQSTATDIAADFPKTLQKIRHTPLGAQLVNCQTQSKKKAQATKPYILFIGTVEPRKNLNRLLEAYALLSNDIKKQYKLVIAGGKGWGQVNLKSHIKQLHLEEHVVLHGYVNEETLSALYQQAYCLVMPSLYEGFGLPILEAQHFGVPVVTSNTSSMPEVVGEGGILIDPYSVPSIRQGLETILLNTTLRDSLSIKAKNNASQYSWDKTAKLTLEAFKEAIQLKNHKQSKKTLNVLHVCQSSLPRSMGGIEVFIDTLSNTTAKQGINNTVLSLDKNPSETPIPIGQYTVYHAKEHIRVASTGFSLSAFPLFKQLASEADIIHYHFPNPFSDLLHFICRIKKPSLVSYHSDIIKQKHLIKCYRPLMKCFLNSVNHLVATSPNYLQSSEVLQHYSDKTSVIPIGLDIKHYPKPDSSKLDYWREKLPQPFFLFVGVTRYYKGLHTALDAIKDSPLQLVIVGKGGVEQDLHMQAQKNHLDNVTFLGSVSDEDKVALLQLCYAFVFPSHLRSEAFGISLLEAAHYGKALISCEIGTGTSYINAHDETGLVIPPESPHALRMAMLDLLNNPEKTAELGRNAKLRASKLFTAEQQAHDYAALYKELYRAQS